MKCFLTFIMVLLTLTRCYSLGLVDPDAPKKDPERSKALRSGAKTKMELHVVDDEGYPVPNANVKVTLGMVTTANIIKGQTDTNGVFIIEGKTRGNEIIIQPKKDGYYNSEKTISFWKFAENRKVKNGKWQPYGEKVEIVLRKKRNPLNLISEHRNGAYKHTKLFYQWIGFDIKENDFVEPHGKGKIIDFEVMIEWDQKINENYTGMSVKIRFTDPYAGYYVVDKKTYSDFKGQYTALPSNITLTNAMLYEKKLENGDWIEKNYDENSCWVIRSRCVVNEKGELISANYSEIYKVRYSCNMEGDCGFGLYRVFNPTPNDTNLEPANVKTSDGFTLEKWYNSPNVLGKPEQQSK